MKYLLTARATSGEVDQILFDEKPVKTVEGGQITYTGMSGGEEAELTLTPAYYSMWKVTIVADDYQIEP